MVTASSCGSLCRKGNSGDYVLGERLFFSLADNSMRFCLAVRLGKTNYISSGMYFGQPHPGQNHNYFLI